MCPLDNVIETIDVKTIYEAPISFSRAKIRSTSLRVILKLKPKRKLI